MSNPGKRANAPPSGDTPGKRPPKKTCNQPSRSRKTLFQSEFKPSVCINAFHTVLFVLFSSVFGKIVSKHKYLI